MERKPTVVSVMVRFLSNICGGLYVKVIGKAFFSECDAQFAIVGIAWWLYRI